MNLETLQQQWEKDSSIDDTQLDKESISVPTLHAKYYKYYNEFRLMKEDAEMKLKILYKSKWEYYNGKAPEKVYAEAPFDHKVLKQDISIYIDADEEVIKARLKVRYNEIILEFLESVLKTISNRTFQVKNAIDWRRFTEGVL
jgi:hypothetical protein